MAKGDVREFAFSIVVIKSVFVPELDTEKETRALALKAITDSARKTLGTWRAVIHGDILPYYRDLTKGENGETDENK